MSLRVKIEPIGKDIEVLLRQDLALPHRQKLAADEARGGFNEANAVNRRVLGRQPPYTVHAGTLAPRLGSLHPGPSFIH